LSGHETLQGNALGTLAAASRYVLVLTGTLIGGYARDLHAILWRLCPELMRGQGYDLSPFKNSNTSSISRNQRLFEGRYGVQQFKVVTEGMAHGRDILDDVDVRKITDKLAGRGRVYKTPALAKPGINPNLFNHYLIGRSVFMGLTEIAEDLPPIERELVGVGMSSDLATAYRSLEDDFQNAIKNRKSFGGGFPRLAGTRLQTLGSYVDKPWGWDPVMAEIWEKGERSGRYEVVATPTNLEELHEDIKDDKLVELCSREIHKGHKCAVYAIYTQRRDVRPKIEVALRRVGLRALVMPDNVSAQKREQWILRNQGDIDVLIVNPKKVMTGLDLLEFPTLIFYQVGYSTHVLRQASARARRPGQTNDCRVIYMYYKDTIQEKALALMGEKEAASQALEGVFDTKALRALMNGGVDNDILGALAGRLEEELLGLDPMKTWNAQPKERSTTTWQPVSLFNFQPACV